MHKTLLLAGFSLAICSLKAQTAKNIIADLTSINNTVTNVACSGGKGNIISNRAMNIFLANKVGTYLSGIDDLSLYKNSITFNTTEGTFSVSHNMRQAKGIDEPVKSSLIIGAKANVLNGFTAMLNNNHSVNDFGVLVKKTWMGKSTTYFRKCTATINLPAGHKQSMDAWRASILNLIKAEINHRDSLFRIV